MKVLLAILFLVIFMNISTIAQINVKFEQYQLDNGLNVILHEDHNAPVASVSVMYHVGSKNEKPKRTGFAHLFEHMMFQGSQHVGDNEHFKLLQEVGANVNGFTQQDGTTYFEVLPSNYVELGLYLESDRMGFLLPAMTQEKLDNQRDVVKNERRQNYENRPYGLADEKISKVLYPATHPYNWPVIGFMEDLSAASLEDVKDFFKTYYAPNNACLVVSGDINSTEVKPMIQKYFGTILKGKPFDRPQAVPVSLEKEVRIFYEDKVQLPRLYLTWHSAAGNTREDAVMSVFSDILSSGKNSRFYKSMVYDKQIAQNVRASQGGSEIAGEFQITVTPKPEKNLTEMEKAIGDILADVLKNGVTQSEIDKSVTNTEVQVVNSVATALGKGNALAANYFLTGDANSINKQMDLYKGITPDEVINVAKKYLSQPNVVLSVVPLGKPELAAKKGE
ncbi:MAG: insulinase family protein [Ignavibacteriales bacterium]|nr:insulinase family protein [Ignavibacteriales bacterium]